MERRFIYMKKKEIIKIIKSKRKNKILNLSGSNLSESDLRGIILSGSDLRRTDLRGSNLSECDLSGSNLSWSNLRGSDLSGSNLSWCNLRGSDLRGSDLRGSDLSGSNLSWCDLSGSKITETTIFSKIIISEEQKKIIMKKMFEIKKMSKTLLVMKKCVKHSVV